MKIIDKQFTLYQWMDILKIDKGTQFDREHGLKTEGINILKEYGDIIFLSSMKTNNSETLRILFRVGLGSDKWFIWTPTEEQANVMIEKFPNIYFSLEKRNKDGRTTVIK